MFIFLNLKIILSTIGLRLFRYNNNDKLRRCMTSQGSKAISNTTPRHLYTTTSSHWATHSFVSQLCQKLIERFTSSFPFENQSVWSVELYPLNLKCPIKFIFRRIVLIKEPTRLTNYTRKYFFSKSQIPKFDVFGGK